MNLPASALTLAGVAESILNLAEKSVADIGAVPKPWRQRQIRKI